MSHGSELLAKLAEHHTAMEETIRSLHESCVRLRERAVKAEARVKELEADLLHERNRFNCVAIEQKNAPVAGVADRIVTSPEFRAFLKHIDDPDIRPEAAADLIALLDLGVKR